MDHIYREIVMKNPELVDRERLVLRRLAASPALARDLNIRQEDFLSPASGRVFVAIREAAARANFARPVEPKSLVPDFVERHPDDVAALMAVSGVDESAAAAVDEGRIMRLFSDVADSVAKAKMIAEMEDIVRNREIFKSAGKLHERLLKIAAEANVSRAVSRDDFTFDRMVDMFAEEMHEEIRYARNPLLTRIPALDACLQGGIRRDDLIIVGGRTGQYKTSLAMNLMKSVVEQGKRAMLLCVEMNMYSLMGKFISLHGNIPSAVFRNAVFSPQMVNRIITELMKYKEIHEQRVKDPFIIVPAMQAMNLTVQGIVQVVQRYMERTGGVDLLIVDYAQRLRLAPEESQMQRYLQIKGIAEGFRDFSSNYKVPTVLLAQLKRGENVFHEGKRKVQRPRLEDLKESGALEENASSVLLTHYPYKYEYQEVFADDAAEVASREGFADRTYLELYVEKNRFGASTMLPLKVDDKFGIITQGQPRGF